MRRKPITRLVAAIIAAVVCLVLPAMLSACGDTGQTVVDSATPSAPASATPAVQSETPSPAPETGSPSAGGSDEVPSLQGTYADYFLIGTVFNARSTSGPDKTLTLTHFNAITPENLMKPQYMQPSKNNFEFGESDAMIKYAEDNGLKVIGHTLVWHQQSGNWLGMHVSRDEAIEQLKSHITTIVGKYKGKIMAWDVVNEAISDGVQLPADGDWTKCLRETQWLNSIGPDYIEMAFSFAHEADPDAKLYYNDYNLNEKNKADIVHAMVKDLKQRGVPVDGIGMQGHYSSDISIGSVEYSLELFSELGVEVSITELDVTVNAAAGSKQLTEEQEVEQAIVYARLFRLFKEYKDLIARVTIWGTTDGTSWRKDRFPLLFNADYTPKEAFYAVLDPETYLEEHNFVEKAEAKTAKALYETPTIDGEIEDIWAACPEVPVNIPVMAWEGAKGKVRVLWDENFVYCLFEVEDAVLNSSSVNPYEHDSIEIFLDQNNGKTPFYESDDGQYRVNYDGLESFGNVPDTPGFVSAAKRTANGFLVELAIPLKSTAAEGMVMGFDAQVNDANDQGIRQSIMKFNDETDNTWSSLERTGNLELVK